MSKQDSLSIGVSSFSLQQDLVKLRQCLGSTEGENSEEYTTGSNASQIAADTDVSCDKSPKGSKNVSQSRIITCNADSFSVSTEGTSTNSKQDAYLRDHRLEAALVTNEMYQEALEEAIARLEMALLQNEERRKYIQYELDKCSNDSAMTNNKSLGSKAKHWEVLCAPYLKDMDGFPFPENAAAQLKRLTNEVSPYVSEPLKWSKHEQALLYSAVKVNLKKNMIEPYLQKKELYTSKLSDSSQTAEMRKEIESALNVINAEISEKTMTPDSEILSQNPARIDWMQISAQQLNCVHSPECCKLMWQNVLRPGINNEDWSKEEDEMLTALVKEEQAHTDWDLIAEDLGTNRTAEQCIRRFNGHLNNFVFHKGYWTTTENKILRNAVEELREGDKIPWGKVSSYLESREPRLIRKHWEFNLNHEIKKGPWTLEEDIMLLIGKAKYGMLFKKICQLLPGRTYMQCRARYIESLSMDINFGKWSVEEDRNLIELAKKLGTKWADIANSLKGRTATMVRQRYSVIINKIPDAYERIELDISEWPLTPTHINNLSIHRRRIAHRYVNKRLQMLRNVAPGKFPAARISLKGARKIPENEMVPIREEQHPVKDYKESKILDFVITETKNILSRPVRKAPQTEDKTTLRIINDALDALLLPSIVCRETGYKKSMALSGKDSLEFEFARRALFRALNVPLDKDNDFVLQELDIPVEERMGKTKKFELRTEYFVHCIQRTMSEQCLGSGCIGNSGQMVMTPHILPPTRPIVGAFKLMVMDRERVTDVASQVGDATVVRKITETSPNKKPKCWKCSSGSSISYSYSRSSQVNSGQQRWSTTGQSNTVDFSCQNCEDCAHLERLQASYLKFRDRFLALFFWPAQMLLVTPPENKINPSPDYFVPPSSNANEKQGKRKRKRQTRKGSQSSSECLLVVNPPKMRKRRESKFKNAVPVRSSERQATRKDNREFQV